MQDHLFVSDLMALRKRRANVAHALAEPWRLENHFLRRQLRRTFLHLTVVELRLTDKVDRLHLGDRPSTLQLPTVAVLTVGRER